MEKIEQIFNNTNKILEFIEKGENQSDWTVWLPVIASFITAIIAFLGILYSTRYVKNNIRMDARIEWIQKVRETVARVISLCYLVVYEINEEEVLKNFLKAKEQINLLMLYFGPDEIGNKDFLGLNEQILKKEDKNIGKNDHIVAFLEKLLLDIEKYYQRKHSSRAKMLEIELRCLNKKYDLEDTGERLIDNEGNWVNVKGRPKEYYEEKNKLEKEKSELENPNNILEDIANLREIMRLYLKIEWTVAKEGK